MFYFNRLAFSMYIKMWRNMHHLTAGEFCDLNGIATGTLSYLESNDMPPKIETFVAICNTMDVDPSYFFANRKKGE